MTTRLLPDPLHDRIVAWIDEVYSPEHRGAATAAVDGLLAALDVAREAEHQALRCEDQLPVPEWVPELRRRVAAALGVTTDGR